MAYTDELTAAIAAAKTAGNAEDVALLSGELNRVSGATPSAKTETYNPTEGMSTSEKALAGAGKFFVDTGRGIGQMLGVVSKKDIDEAKKRDEALMNTRAGMLGNIGAGVVSTLPLAAIPGAATLPGAMVTGGVLGATSPEVTGESRINNAAIGGLGGFLGQGAANVVGRVVKPIKSELDSALKQLAVRAERDFGIPLNVAQRTGSVPVSAIDSALANLPLTSTPMALEKEAQRTAYNKAVLQQIGEKSEKATPDVMAKAKSRISGQFEDISKRNKVNLDTDFESKINDILKSTNEFSSPEVAILANKAKSLAGETITGGEYQAMRSTLGAKAKSAWNSDAEKAQALKGIQTALDDAANASVNPKDRKAWDTARSQWAKLKAVEEAASPTHVGGVQGDVDPNVLMNALYKGNKNSLLYGTGDQTMPDLARIGKEFLGKNMTDSPMAKRWLYQGMLTGAGGLGAYVASNPENLSNTAYTIGGSLIAPVLARKALHSPAGRNYFSEGLIGKGPASQRAADMARQALVGGSAQGALSSFRDKLPNETGF